MTNELFAAARRFRAMALVAAVMLAGCSHSGNTGTQDDAAAARQKAQQQAQAAAQKRDEERQELDQIPPPAKSRYMGIRTVQSWNNPFLTIGKDTVTLRVLYPEQAGPDITPNNLLRPAAARKRELELRLSDLPEALSALPENLWPYGRVIAVQEDPAALKPDRPQVRRNVEATMQLLGDLGVVAYEWPGGEALR